MKAKEYAEKYKRIADPSCTDSEFARLLDSLWKEMLGEMKGLISLRHIQTWSSLSSLEREFNQKGNAISRELSNILKKDWFKTLTDDIKVSLRK